MRKILLIVLLASQAHGAIRVDSVYGPVFASASTLTIAATVPTTCQNSLLVACCGNDASTFSSIKYGGLPMTNAVTLGSTETSAIYYIASSTNTGSNNIVATNGAAVNVMCSAMTLCGVDQTNPKDSSASAQTTGANPTLATTVVSSGSFIIPCFFNNATTFAPAPTAASNIVSQFTNSGGPSTLASGYQGPLAAGSQSMPWTTAQSAAWTKTIISVDASTGTPILTTQAPTAITRTTATGNGTLLNWGGFTVTANGCVVATHVNPDLTDTVVAGSGTDTYTCNITGLTPATGYHVRAYATNSQGTDYGQDVPFGTLPNSGITTTPGTGSITFSNPDSGGIITIQ